MLANISRKSCVFPFFATTLDLDMLSCFTFSPAQTERTQDIHPNPPCPIANGQNPEWKPCDVVGTGAIACFAGKTSESPAAVLLTICPVNV